MKKLAARTLALFTIVFLPLFANADSDSEAPEKALLRMIKTVQKAKAPMMLLDYIDWEVAYANIPASDRLRFDLRSPRNLRDRFELMNTNPQKYAEKLATENNQGVPPEQTPEIVAGVKNVAEGIKAALQASLDATYEVGEPIYDVRVPLKRSLSGKTEVSEARMIKKNGTWFLVSPDTFSNFKPAP